MTDSIGLINKTSWLSQFYVIHFYLTVPPELRNSFVFFSQEQLASQGVNAWPNSVSELLGSVGFSARTTKFLVLGFALVPQPSQRQSVAGSRGRIVKTPSMSFIQREDPGLEFLCSDFFPCSYAITWESLIMS